MILDITFVVYSLVIIFLLLPLYIYRKKILSFKYRKGEDFHLFVKDIKLYMNQNHPKIKIDYSIIGKSENEKDIKIRETIIVENIVKQFFEYHYSKNTQNIIEKEKLWPNYEEKSKPNNKYPSDWPQRKELVWKRDEKSCKRCGNKLELKNSYISFVKNIEDNGGYNFENIFTLCADCNMILNSTNKNILASLSLNDKLMFFVKA